MLLRTLIEQTLTPDFVVAGPLFRGISRDSIPGDIEQRVIHQRPVRQDRRPRDSSVPAAVIFNKLFEAAHGVRDLRSRCVFCANDMDIASRYTSDFGFTEGNDNQIAIILPPRGARLTYCRDISDSAVITLRLKTIWNLNESSESDDKFQSVEEMSQAQPHEVHDRLQRITLKEGTFGEQVWKNAERIKDYVVTTIDQFKPGDAGGSAEIMLFDIPSYHYVTVATVKAIGGDASLQSISRATDELLRTHRNTHV